MWHLRKVSKEDIIYVRWNARIRLRIFRQRRKGIIDFIVQLEYLVGKWIPVIRYDNAHGFLHKDVYSKTGNKKRREEIIAKTLKDAVKIAYKDLSQNYEEYVRRFEEDKL